MSKMVPNVYTLNVLNGKLEDADEKENNPEASEWVYALMKIMQDKVL